MPRQIRDEVGGVFEAHREPHHAPRDAGLRQRLVVQAELRGQDRQAAQALDTAQAGRALEELQAIEGAEGRRLSAREVDADHAAEAAHLRLRDGVVRMRRQARVVHRRKRRMPLQRLCDGQRRLVVTGHTERERLHAAAEGVGRLRVEDAAEQPPRLGQTADEAGPAGEHAAGDIAVAVQVAR